MENSYELVCHDHDDVVGVVLVPMVIPLNQGRPCGHALAYWRPYSSIRDENPHVYIGEVGGPNHVGLRWLWQWRHTIVSDTPEVLPTSWWCLHDSYHWLLKRGWCYIFSHSPQTGQDTLFVSSNLHCYDMMVATLKYMQVYEEKSMVLT